LKNIGSFVNKLKSGKLRSRAKPPSTQRNSTAEALEKLIGMDVKALTKP